LQDSTNFALSGSNVKAEFEIRKDLWPADIDVEQINRVIHNLVVNADQSMPNGGIVKICAENAIIPDNNPLSLPGGRFIKISVIDHGEGIPAHNLKYIFDPYFTTRQRGSGLGLAMTYSVIKNHGGTIVVDSTVGIGTTFRVYLPASEQSLSENLSQISTNYSLKGKRILLVDDEEMIRDVTGRILKHMGVGEVLIAGDGQEALRVYEQAQINGAPVDVVIMDLTIPGGMGGKDAIQELLKINPDIRAIVSSGYASDPILSDYKRYGFKGVLVKPYKIQELDKVLGDVITGLGS
jgi:two-component system, cell cycle sensor histidine kinase and response regulator CckA